MHISEKALGAHNVYDYVVRRKIKSNGGAEEENWKNGT